jgi:hypothetical protein
MLLMVVSAVFALIPIAITVNQWYDVHRRMDTVAHSTAGISLAAASVALLPLPDIGHVLLVTAIGVLWEVIEPRLVWLPSIKKIHTPPQDTEADIAVVGLSASLLVMVVI